MKTTLGCIALRKTSRQFSGLAGYGLLAVTLVLPAGGAAPDASVFKLREVSVFDDGKGGFIRGQMCRCELKPISEVKKYPDFASQAPIFGAIRFAARHNETNSGWVFHFAVDESRGNGKGYDRLYFDGNRDLDLRNDPIAKLQPQSPDRGYKPNFSDIKTVTTFDFLRLNLSTDDSRQMLVEVMPRLLLVGDKKETYPFMFFVRTHLFEGDLKIGGEEFKASLGNDHFIYPSLDSPQTALKLTQRSNTFTWWGGDRLSAIHRLNGRYFMFAATPSGDELTVTPYRGDLGVFEIGPGDRTLTNLSVSGSLEAPGWSVPVGGEIRDGRPEAASCCHIPVGDYLPLYLTIQFGRLRVELSQNYHSEGVRQNRAGRPSVYGIAIRKDQPFVMDFSNKPDVMFVSPAKDQRIRLGDTLMVAAVLVDPQLDIMIRRLADISPRRANSEDNPSLDPKVIVTRTNGERVAEGLMPFG